MDTNPTAAQPLDLDKLEALAIELGGLHWKEAKQYTDAGGLYYEISDTEGNVVIGDCGPDKVEASFIAAANPAAILQLIAQARAAKPESATGTTGASVKTWQERVGQDYNDSAEPTAHEIAMEAEIADLRAQLAAAQRDTVWLNSKIERDRDSGPLDGLLD